MMAGMNATGASASSANRHDRWPVAAPGLRIVRQGHAPIQRIQIYGERCSGTHLITRLIERNFGESGVTSAFGFKHWFVPDQILFTDDVLALVIVRSPTDWLRSLHRQPWHTTVVADGFDFATFIRTPWASFWDEAFAGVGPDHPLLGSEMMHERDPESGDRFANPIALRTAKLRHWTALPYRAHNVALLSYEALRDAPQAIIAALARTTGMSNNAFIPVDSYKGQGFYRYEPTPYAPMTRADAAHVTAWSDPDIEALFAVEGSDR